MPFISLEKAKNKVLRQLVLKIIKEKKKSIITISKLLIKGQLQA